MYQEKYIKIKKKRETEENPVEDIITSNLLNKLSDTSLDFHRQMTNYSKLSDSNHFQFSKSEDHIMIDENNMDQISMTRFTSNTQVTEINESKNSKIEENKGIFMKKDSPNDIETIRIKKINSPNFQDKSISEKIDFLFKNNPEELYNKINIDENSLPIVSYENRDYKFNKTFMRVNPSNKDHNNKIKGFCFSCKMF